MRFNVVRRHALIEDKRPSELWSLITSDKVFGDFAQMIAQLVDLFSRDKISWQFHAENRWYSKAFQYLTIVPSSFSHQRGCDTTNVLAAINEIVP